MRVAGTFLFVVVIVVVIVMMMVMMEVLDPSNAIRIKNILPVSHKFVWHIKISVIAPVLAPGISHDQNSLGVIITHGAYGMSSKHCFAMRRHWHLSGICSIHEGLVDPKAKNDWKAH